TKGEGWARRCWLRSFTLPSLALAPPKLTRSPSRTVRRPCVTNSLGYRPNGSWIDDREGTAARHLRFVMTRADWEQRRGADITIDNLDPCLAFLGLTETST